MGFKPILIIGLLFTASLQAASVTMSLGTPFQPTQAGGPFRYGWATTLNGTVYDASNYNGSWQPWGESWSDPSASAYLLIGHNSSGTPQTLGSSVYSTDGVLLHPGSIAEFSVLRFIAPLTGYYSIVGTFARADMDNTGNGVAVSVGAAGRTIWDNNGSNILAAQYGSTLAFNLVNLPVVAGDNFYFFVGHNGDLTNDLTFLSGQITISDSPVPEPSTYALGLTGLIGLLVARRRS